MAVNFIEVILHKIFSKLASEDTIDAFDIQKWGRPVTKGEAHFINEEVHDRFYSTGGSAEASLKSALWLSNIYEYYIQDQFAYFRRGWVVEYMGDAYAQNAFERAMFVLVARVPFVRGFVLNLQRSVERLSRSEAPTPPQGLTQQLASIGWTTLTFYLGQAAFGALASGAVFTDPLGFLITYPIVIGGFLLAFMTWYGKYGLWLPIAGVQTIGSALTYVGLWVMTIVIAIRFSGVIPVIGPMIQSAAVAGMTVGGTYIPNPLFLGLGPFMEGMITGEAALGAALLLWGLAGVGNAFYAELEEAHSKKAKQAKRVADLVAKKVKREVGE